MQNIGAALHPPLDRAAPAWSPRRQLRAKATSLASYDELAPFVRSLHRPTDDDAANVYTYVDLTHSSRALSQGANAIDLLSLWAASWARHGWRPRILTRADVEQSAGYAEFIRIASMTATNVSRARGHNSATDSTFRIRGLTQFYAKAVVGAGVLTDSDVINFGLTPADVAAASVGATQGSVVIHDARNCEEIQVDNRSASYPFRPQGYSDGSASTRQRGLIVCVKTNNGLTSGSGQAYHHLVNAILRFQQDVISGSKQNVNIGLMTEMRILNMLGPRGHGFKPESPATNSIITVSPLCVTFNAMNGAWRRAKAHFYGSGIANWVERMCRVRSSAEMGAAATEVAAWRAAGLCSKKVSRAKFIRFLRDPLL
jgi:hypothetical protein